MRMAASHTLPQQHQLTQYSLLAPPQPAATQASSLLGRLGPTTTAGDSGAEVIFSIGRRAPQGVTGALMTAAPISQSSSTSSSYGTTTSTTIALPLETPLRYAPFVATANGGTGINNNFAHNYNNNLNTTSVGTCHLATSMSGGSNNFSSNFNNNNNNNNNNADLASVDSSDTYASCQTHPFLSQGDLTSDLADEACALDIDMDNLYINPMEKDTTSSGAGAAYMVTAAGTTGSGMTPTSSSSMLRSHVKKSASGDTALRNLAAGGVSPMDDVYQQFDVQERGSRVSLNETPVPKHRKTRFQQSFITSATATASVGLVKPRARFEDSQKMSQESLGLDGSPASSTSGKKKRSSFMPTKSLATATKLINQHLFGLQSVGSKAKFESKHSSSIDSIDASPNLEHHRRSKSILKNKSDISRVLADPESERLLADNMSGSGISDNGTVMGESGSDYSPNKIPHSVLAKSISPPPLRHRTLVHQRSGPALMQSQERRPTKFQTPRYPEEQALRQVKPMLARSTAASHMSGDSRYDSTNRDSSLDSETTFTSNVNIREEAGGSGGGEAGSSDENRSLLQHGNSDDKSDSGTAAASGSGVRPS